MSLFPGNAGQLEPVVISRFARAWQPDDAEVKVQFMIYISSWWEGMLNFNPTATNPRPQVDGSIVFETGQPPRLWRFDLQQGSIQVMD